MSATCLDELLKLQQLDLRLRDLELRLKTIPQEMKSMISKRDAILAKTSAAANAVRRIELDIKSSEAEASRLQAENAKLLQQSSQVKKQTEYQAMLQAIENNKKHISDEEEKTILLYDELEAAKKNYVTVKKDNEDEIKIIKSEFDEMIDFSKKVELEIAKLKKARPELQKQIPPDIFSTYSRLLNGKNGTPPVCAVENGICGGRHLRVTPQTENDIFRERMAVCDNCQCFVYLPEE
ncbi:MAG: hypothetical protein J6Q80_01965 [Lentisphaeria bacterium]|nr:hypothetical protein [Lentisphaeria bacterium]